MLASASAYLNGRAGTKHHLGYGSLARAAFGLWGSYLVVMLNVFQSFVFYGTQVSSDFSVAWAGEGANANTCVDVFWW